MSQGGPNFLIVGAAKSGTTSLYHYLNQHPDIYMSPVKEPDYFGGYSWNLPLHNIHGPNPSLQIYQDWCDYLKLFSEGENKVTGEASPSTLYYYKQSIPEINRRLKNPKIIILVRDPVERAFSHYRFLKRDGKENLSFKDALQVESKRMMSNYHYGYYYKALGFYFNQISAFKNSFSTGIWTFERLKSDTANVYNEICQYLDVSTDYQPDFSLHYNVSGVPKINALNKFLREKSRIRDFFRPLIDRVLNEEIKTALVERLHHVNMSANDPMNPEIRKKLTEEYNREVNLLSQGLGIDVTGWKSLD